VADGELVNDDDESCYDDVVSAAVATHELNDGSN